VNALAPFLVGGAAARPDSVSGLRPEFAAALQGIFAAAPEDIRGMVQITSGYRSPEVQARLYQEALARYGSEREARRWVAPPGRSRHNHGDAADLKFGNDAAREWFHQNAEAHGLTFPMSWEPWHIEMAGARGGPVTRTAQAAGNAAADMGGAQPGQNALAAYGPQPGQNPRQPVQQDPRRNSLMLDPRAFMVETSPVQPAPFVPQRYLTGGRPT